MIDYNINPKDDLSAPIIVMIMNIATFIKFL